MILSSINGKNTVAAYRLEASVNVSFPTEELETASLVARPLVAGSPIEELQSAALKVTVLEPEKLCSKDPDLEVPCGIHPAEQTDLYMLWISDLCRHPRCRYLLDEPE